VDVLASLGQIFVDIGANAKQFQQTMQQVEDRMRDVGDKMSKVGEGLSKSFTAPLLALGGVAGFVAAEFEGSNARIQNSLGVSAEEADRLSESARGIYKNGFGESLDDVTTALLATKQNMKNLSDSDLEKITNQAMVLGQTFDADVNEITRAGSNMMKAFGMTSEEAMDLMAHGAQNGLNFSNELT
jgi:phage-related minor tail protein